MSLLDEVSVMITPNGRSTSSSIGDEYVMYGVLPEPTTGTELVTDGQFPTGTSAWTTGAGWTISGNKAHRDGSGGSNSDIKQSISVVSGKDYTFSYTRTYASGNGETNIYVKTNGVDYRTIGKYVSTVVEEHTVISRFTALFTGSMEWKIYGIGDWTGTIENVSVKEYTSGDLNFTRATTATYVNYADVINTAAQNVPRIDYTDVSCPHILAEPARTNICLRSAEFDNATWAKNNGGTGLAPVVTAETGQVTSPNGGNNADKVVFDLSGGTSSSDFSYLYQTYTQAAGSYSLSCYLRGADGSENISFDFGGVEVNTVTLTTDWVRYTFTKAVTSTGSTTIRIGLRGGVTSTDNPTIYMWGCQLEKAAYATSYIPTTSTSITRNGDRFTKKGISDLINSSEGVLYIEMAALVDAQTYRIISLSDGTEDQRVYIQYTNASQTVAGVIKRNGVTQANMSYTLTDETAFSKIAVKWKEDDFALWVDGTERGTDSAGNTPIGLNSLQFDNGKATAANFFYGKVRNLQLYKTALSDTQLGALTS
tara:strand:+ start:837 stop:2450 length:1614 start_codon:yes stop_codon:yes gene_type:complete